MSDSEDEDYLREYATHLIELAAKGVEWSTIHEVAEDYFEEGFVDEDEAEQVRALIESATITVTWPEG